MAVNHDTKDMTRHYMSLALSLTPYLLERIMELNQYLCMMNADANLIRIRYLCFLFLFLITYKGYFLSKESNQRKAKLLHNIRRYAPQL